MTGGYKAAATGRTMKAGYAVWDVDNAYWVDGQNAVVYATFAEAQRAAITQEMRDIVTRHRAGTGKGPQASGKTFAPVTPRPGRLL